MEHRELVLSVVAQALASDLAPAPAPAEVRSTFGSRAVFFGPGIIWPGLPSQYIKFQPMIFHTVSTDTPRVLPFLRRSLNRTTRLANHFSLSSPIDLPRYMDLHFLLFCKILNFGD